MKIKNIGKVQYLGFDGKDIVNIAVGEVAEVTDELGARLLTDETPGEFELVKEVAAKPEKAKKD